MGYLPVQSVLEGDALESPIPSPQHGTHTLQNDMHSRLEMYASRLAQVECGTRTNSTPDSDDEHQLIAQYCQSLPAAGNTAGGGNGGPKSPVQVMAAMEAEQREELETMIKELEEENANLQAEYEKLKATKKSTPITTPDEGYKTPTSASNTASAVPSTASAAGGGSVMNFNLKLYFIGCYELQTNIPQYTQDMVTEAKLLRQHKGRLEARMQILEDHNKQLEAQLQRLRQLLHEVGGFLLKINLVFRKICVY